MSTKQEISALFSVATAVSAGEGTSAGRTRVAALDFTKGALVLIMVLYHWLDFFVTRNGRIFDYLRFLTPSFIFITGFMISQHYSSRYGDRMKIGGRLERRGVKLLAIALFLNLAPATLGVLSGGAFGGWHLISTATAVLTASSRVGFGVLVAISYLLILAGVLTIVGLADKIAHLSLCFIFIICALVLEIANAPSGYLQLITIGTLGLCIGHVPLPTINRITVQRGALFFLWAVYQLAVTAWSVPFVSQIVGVCISVAVLYSLGLASGDAAFLPHMVIRLGQYSLCAYIVQIAILQGLRRGTSHFQPSVWVAGAALISCTFCLTAAMELLHRARLSVPGINRLYLAIFG